MQLVGSVRRGTGEAITRRRGAAGRSNAIHLVERQAAGAELHAAPQEGAGGVKGQ
jgi:hypothetical protein